MKKKNISEKNEKKLKKNKAASEETKQKITYYEQEVEPVYEESKISVEKCKKRSEDFEFSYYNKDQFKEYKEKLKDEQPDVIPEELGFFKLTKRFKDKGDNVIVIKNNKFDVKNKNRNIFRKTAGYVKVSEFRDRLNGEKFIILTKLRLLPIILIFTLILSAGVVFWPDSPLNPLPNNPNHEIESGTDWTGELPGGEDNNQAAAEYIEVPGYGEITLTADNKYMFLINPTGNTVYMKYDIYDGNNLVYQTKLIPPGKMVQWEAAKTLIKGEYSLKLKITTYDLETQAGCNGATQNAKLTIK